MAFQPLRVIKSRTHPGKRTVVVQVSLNMGGIWRFHGISPKWNTTAQPEFELTYSNVTGQHVNHYPETEWISIVNVF